MVDMFDSKSNTAMCVGSSPIPGKLYLYTAMCVGSSTLVFRDTSHPW